MGDRLLRLLVIAMVSWTTGCASPRSQTCDFGGSSVTCPPEHECDAVHALCVTHAQATVCDALRDGDVCDAAGTPGICDRGYCVSGCGDGVRDPAEQCDDGNFTSRDGCSSSCRLEIASWQTWSSEWAERNGAAMTYDAAHDVLVVVGGSDDQRRYSDEVWLRDRDRNWTLLAGPGPTARTHASIAFDSARGRVVLFGGDSAAGLLADTWELSGMTWTHVTTATSPPPRLGGAMIFDSSSNRIVLFGGQTGADTFANDTWEYDGTNWSPRSPSTPPPPRVYAAFAWDGTRAVLAGGLTSTNCRTDTWSYQASTGAWTQIAATGMGRFNLAGTYVPERGHVVVYGGLNCDGSTADQHWELVGSTWQAGALSVRPSGRIDTAVAYDSYHHALVTVGGMTANGVRPADDVWELGASAWSTIPSRFVPIARTSPLAYDRDADVVMMFSGYLSPTQPYTQAAGDTWVFDGTRWIVRSPAVSPPARRYHALTYDEARHCAVLFGGMLDSNTTLTNETFEWRWNATTRQGEWTQRLSPAAPSARLHAGLTFSARDGVSVLFGGALADGTPLADTWEFDGMWHARASLSPTPPATPTPAMVYDTNGQRVLLVATDGSTWSYADHAWSELVPADPRARRYGARLVFDAVRNRAVLLGGSQGSDIDVLELDLAARTWANVALPGTAPLPRSFAGAAANGRAEIVMFGGFSAANVLTNDVWLLQYRSDSPLEICGNDVDDDLDRQPDCRDPDCGVPTCP